MIRPIDLLRQGRKEELWQMCCGFIDLSLEQFMAIQKRLLLEQMELLKKSELGRKVMRGAMPQTVEEFREQVPLTTYADYCPELPEKREDVLPAKVARWVRTSGHTGEYDVKWVPMAEDFALEYEKVAPAVALFAACSRRGDTSAIREHLKVLYTVGPPEYGTGVGLYLGSKAVNPDLLPANAEGMSFPERIQAGFKEAMYRGLDGFGGIASVLVAVGEQLKQQSEGVDIAALLSHPQALFRGTKALLKSKLARRPMLPKDIWRIKWVVGGGSDCSVFKDKVHEMWGRHMLEIYAGTEGGIYATQTWDYEGMTFIPNLNFFEFIPEREYFKWQIDHSYQPKTVLLDEVKPGENYEIVITNLHGGIMTRYRVGDMIKITSLRNDKLNIDIPQMVFHSRADELIIITGLGYITEKLLWEAIENTGIPYVDWTARKETMNGEPVLHIYIEPKEKSIGTEESIATAIREEFRKLERLYEYNPYPLVGNLEGTLNLRPVRVTLLHQGAFSAYTSQRQAEGADLGHLKPPHINPSDRVLSMLGVAPAKVEAAAPTEGERAGVR